MLSKQLLRELQQRMMDLAPPSPLLLGFSLWGHLNIDIGNANLWDDIFDG
jgi:hypothetical protein